MTIDHLMTLRRAAIEAIESEMQQPRPDEAVMYAAGLVMSETAREIKARGVPYPLGMEGKDWVGE